MSRLTFFHFFWTTAALATASELASDIGRVRGQLPQKILGLWTTSASDRDGVNRLTITLNVAPAEIQWAITCELPDGSQDQDSVTTPAQLRDGYIEVSRRAGSFNGAARPCELGIHEKFLTYSLENETELRLSDFTGKVRTFHRPDKTASRSASALDWKGASRCEVTPAMVDLRFGERALFRVTAPGMTTPSVRTEMRYVGDPTGGLRVGGDKSPVKRGLDATDVGDGDGTARLVRSYALVDMPFASAERRYLEDYPGGVVETVELRQGTARAMCEYRVRLLPEPPASVPGSRAASAALPLR